MAELTQGVIWAEPEADSNFIAYVESILNCKCCQNNYDDPEHRHNEICDPDYIERVGKWVSQNLASVFEG